MLSFSAEEKVVNYLCLDELSFICWEEGINNELIYINYNSDNFLNNIRSMEIDIDIETIGRDSIWNLTIAKLNTDKRFAERKIDFLCEEVFRTDTLSFWNLYKFNEHDSGQLDFIHFTTDSSDEADDFYNQLFKVLADLNEFLDIPRDSLTDGPYPKIISGHKANGNIKMNFAVLTYDNLQDMNRLIFVRHLKDQTILGKNKLKPIPVEPVHQARAYTKNRIFYLLLTVMIIILSSTTSIAIYYFLQKKSKKRNLKMVRRLLTIFRKNEVKNYIFDNNLSGKDKTDTLQNLIIHSVEKIDREVGFKKNINKLEENNRDLLQHIEKLKEKLNDEINANKDLINKNYTLAEEYNRIKDEYINKIEAIQIKHLDEINKLKNCNTLNLNNQKDKYEDDIKKIEQENEELSAYVKIVISLIREIDYASCNFMLEYQKWDNEKSFNNIILYLLFLRTVLNTTYCLLAGQNIENQISNLKQLMPGNNDLIQKLQAINNNKFFFDIMKDKQLAEKSIMKQVYTYFNKRINTFPSHFYFGINNDDVIN